MPASFQEIINSRLFKFIVGEGASEFSVHEDAVAHLSKPLHSLTKGSSSEARAGRARWNDVSKDTFERFVQFAYTGDYSIPTTEKRGSEPQFDQVDTNISTKKNKKKKRRKESLPAVPEPDPEPEPADLAQNHVQEEEESVAAQSELHPEQDPAPIPEESKSAEQTTHILVADFDTLSYPLLASRDNYEGTCEPSTDFNKDHCYSNVLLSHASLYLLGDSQLVDSLKALALFKLHKTLCTFELDDDNIGDITDLARYAYSDGDKPVDEGLGGLRELVCQYLAIHAVELSSDPRFLNLLAGGGQIVKDFFKFQLQRIH
ncbi:hypothetical protein OIDMADRAFT_132189 [Oidiodendron maius Zn]|uniref:BTB domain-containing protein n=1 Tax=Oidiodendron maius (strain Zn) TaxID=913774 RepID=A0A0C3D3A5_OIDMZ|nr:hypothetical protein OIDMADRAFT_132189 [Oidiodendron maius Zn]